MTARRWLHKQEVSKLLATGHRPSFHALSAAGACLFLRHLQMSISLLIFQALFQSSSRLYFS